MTKAGRLIQLSVAAVENVARRPGRHLAACAGLTLALMLLVAGIAINEGLRAENEAAIDAGPDVYATWDAFGRDGILPAEALEGLEALSGVGRVVPRVIGETSLGDEVGAVTGLPLQELGRAIDGAVDLEGRVPRAPNEVLLGVDLARSLGLQVGSTVALDGQILRLFKVSGLAAGASSLWSANCVVCDIAEAQAVFGLPDHVTDACIYTRDGYGELVAEALGRRDPRFRTQTKASMQERLAAKHSQRGGIFTVLFALAVAMATVSFAATAYQGSAPRKQEMGLLMAEGWSTPEILWMVSLESILVSLLVASGAFLGAYAWVEWLGGPFIAPFFLSDLGAFPVVDVPAVFTPMPLMFAFLVSLTATLAGSLPAAWRHTGSHPGGLLR